MREMKSSFEEGRAMQFRQMMEQLELMRNKYKGVRGELLSRVHEELARLEPSPVAPSAPPPLRLAPITDAPPSCRVCGRSTTMNGNVLTCPKGHSRVIEEPVA